MIQEINNYIALYDLTRTFTWRFKSANTVNLIYVIQAENSNGVFVDISGLLRQPMEFGTNGDFYINPSEILADEIQCYIRTKNQGTALMDYNGSVKFRLAMTEETLQPDGTLKFSNLRADWFYTQIAYGIDAAIQHEETFGLAQHQWYDFYRVRAGYTSAKFLTNKPANVSMSVDDNEYIYTFIDTKKPKLHVSIHNAAGVQLHTYATGFLLYGLNSIGIGVPNIIDAITQSTWDTISNTAYKVKYVVKDFQNTEISETREYIINKDKCTKERLRVYWKNRKGGIDGYTFNGELEVRDNVRSKLYKSHRGYRRDISEDVNNLNYIYNNQYGQSSQSIGTTSVSGKNQMTVTSKHHTQEHLRWLSEITTSPNVWVENLQTGQLNSVYSITRKATTKPKGKGIGQMKLSLVMSNEITTQR